MISYFLITGTTQKNTFLKKYINVSHFAIIYKQHDANYMAWDSVIHVAPSTVGVYKYTHVAHNILKTTTNKTWVNFVDQLSIKKLNP